MNSESLRKKILQAGLLQQIPDLAGRNPAVRFKDSAGSLSTYITEILRQNFGQILIITDTDENARFLRADLETLSGVECMGFPATNRKPYNTEQIIDSTLLVQRAETLDAISRKNTNPVITSAEAVFEKVAPPQTLDAISIVINKGDEINLNELQAQLAEQNYNPVRFVDEPGEYAVRGGIVDVFPFSGEYPIRLEFFGDEIDSIREFDPSTQRSVAFLNKARFIPDLSGTDDAERGSFLSYFDESVLLILHNAELIPAEAEKRFSQAGIVYEALDDPSLPPPEELFLSDKELSAQLAKFSHTVHFGISPADHNAVETFSLHAAPQPDFHGNFDLLRAEITKLSKQGIKTVICCDNDGQKQRFNELLGEASAELNYTLAVLAVQEGFIFPDAKTAVFTDHQIFNRYYRPKTKRRTYKGGITFKELHDLHIGDYVVHVDFGIGKFSGFKRISVKGSEQEAVVLRYQEDSILYVNVSSLHKLQKYSGKEGTEPRITKLGSGEWARKKAQTKSRVKDIARDLIKLYAQRKAQQAYAFAPDNKWQLEMEANFKYEETPDQEEAINLVKTDMENSQPMDRLVCGDVGFGKTEVAVRASFKAVMDNKQVGILVPTTILAEQHAKTFRSRLGNFPVNIAAFSRFRTKAEQKQILEDLKSGKLNIIIGTHRLLSGDVQFKDLGLLVVDEEQRFGVSAKEKLKKFKASVDVLTLTATPIPRTLQFSLMGARDLSIINTPPPNRQPIYTEIHSFNEELIKDALLQEMSRGGQVFFIHNRVKNIEEMAGMIRRLVPDIRVRHAHGQMAGAQLEKIITDFYNQKFDVLVSTAIVENGIDISNANTIIINNADSFGLAELHQLRGRVGRSNRKAFCFLITKPIETLTPEARKRLLALEEFSDLGSGFNIAMRDLDIRGAGDILGAEQSGFINDIGFELYTKILNDAVRELKETEFSDMFEGVEAEIELPETIVEFDETALLPSDYVRDNVERLNLYRKLAQAKNTEDISDWNEEIKDRFGALPPEAKYLMEASRIKLFASKSYFTKVTVRSERMWAVCPKPDTPLGKQFYDSGHFQSMLGRLSKFKPDKFQIIQKNGAMRLVIQDIENVSEAGSFLKQLAGGQ